MLLSSNTSSGLPAEHFHNSFASALLQSAARFSDKQALWVEGEFSTYHQLLKKAKSLAATLQHLGQSERPCAVMASRGVTAYQGIWSALLAGGCFVPVNPRFPVARNQSVILSAGCPVLLVGKRAEPAAQQLLQTLSDPISVILPEHEVPPAWANDTCHSFLCRDDLLPDDQWQQPETVNRYAYLLFTSGTTGKPKGIAVSHGNLNAYVQNILRQYPLSASDRFTQMSDLTFDLSVHDWACAWAVGASLYVTPESALLCPSAFVQKHALTCWNSVPSLLGYMQKFRRMKEGAYPHLRYSFFCGEALPTAMAQQWQQATPNGKVINIYGPTEATIAITALEYQAAWAPYPNMPIGEPFESQEAVIVDPQGNALPENVQGELWLGGSQVTDGYWGNEDKTRQCFVNARFQGKTATRWYRTGDWVSRQKGCGLVFHGRKDFQVKVNGFRIELSEIEAVIRQHFDCDWVTVIPWPVDETGAAKGLVAWLSGESGDPQAVREICAKKLPSYMVPTNAFWAQELPKNANGKVDIKALQQQTMDYTKVS